MAAFSWGGEIDFREDFALAQDRSKVLKQLIPGTEDYYYYHALHYLAEEKWQQVEKLFAPWGERHGETERLRQIRIRLALLTYDKQPKKSLEFLRDQLGLTFSHERQLANVDPPHPTKLPAEAIARERFQAEAAPHSQDQLNRYTDAALEWLLETDLNPKQRRSLLTRLKRPDLPKLVTQIAADLGHEHSGGFGSLEIHHKLLLPQLEELQKLRPEVLNQQAFVIAYLRRLQPGAEEDHRRDQEVLAAYLTRLSAFAARLQPVHNSLKAHVLYHQLLLGRLQGKYDAALFTEYLKLPRRVGYAAKSMIESENYRRFACDLNQDYEGATLLPAVGNDEPLVRSYLTEIFKTATSPQAFEPYINDQYLKHLFAETKIVNGLGEPETWGAQLPPEIFQQLKERVDLDFAFTNTQRFAADEPVALELFVKNVNTLIIKVFEINTQNYYRKEQREISTEINLDGLIANQEELHTYTEGPFLRKLRKFKFPKLNQPGVYVIDFIGNGRSSRALIHKGRLRHLVRTTAAGQEFTILDEKNQRVNDATVWLAGHAYEAGKDGTIVVPFSTQPGRIPLVISAPIVAANADPKAAPPTDKRTYSSLDTFEHQAESYELSAGFYVDREALLPLRPAKLLLRAGLKVNGAPVSLRLLQDVKLQVVSTDLEGISSTQEIPEAKLFEDRESLLEFQVPPRLLELQFILTAKVEKLTATGEKAELSATHSLKINEIDKSAATEDMHLLKTSAGYILELRGKTGESQANRPIGILFKHRDFTETVTVTLKTNPEGRIELGMLPDIVSFSASSYGASSQVRNWHLLRDLHTFPAAWHGKAGETISFPFLPQFLVAGKPAEILKKEFSLLELRGDQYVQDRFAHLSLKDGLLTISKLPAGDYDLYLKSAEHHIRLRLTNGTEQGRYLVNPQRQLETARLAPPQIESLNVQVNPPKVKDQPATEKVVIQLRNVHKLTRVHLFATRYEPHFSAFRQLAAVRGGGLMAIKPSTVESVYVTGRDIGDEYRYIIDRKYARKFPGNSLERPSLLLNPWAVRDTETGRQEAMLGEDFAQKMEARPSDAAKELIAAYGGTAAADNSPNLDFLGLPAAVAVNLVPNEQGVIEFDRSLLAVHQRITVVAVDPEQTTTRHFALTEAKPVFADLRLASGLDPQQHFTQQKQVTVVPAGKTFTLHDLNTARFEIYDSLPRVYQLYKTLALDGHHWEEFAFILQWPKLKAEEKREKYSEFASHELNFFLFKKDPEFFQAIVKPYLANKKDKTFLDQFLLEEDLRPYLRPWKYNQLNIVEKILLAKRLKDEGPATARYADDQFKLLPPNLEDFLHRFDTALAASALELDAAGLPMVTSVVPTTDGEVAENGPQISLGLGGLGGGGGGGGMAGRGKMYRSHAGVALADEPQMMKAEKMLKKVEEDEVTKLQLERNSGWDQTPDKGSAEKLARWGAIRGNVDAQRKQIDADGVLSLEDIRADSWYDASGREGELRQAIRALYRQLPKTIEWAENNYHHLPIDAQGPELIGISAFWRDYAQHNPAQPFYSQHLAQATNSFSEMMYALALLDLPFEAPKHEQKREGAKLTLTPGGPLVVFHEEIKSTAAAEETSKVLVSQNFFRHTERQREVDGEMVDQFIRDEFLVQTVYGCQVVVTNPTSTKQKLNVLIEIPRGSLPVLGSRPTKTVYLQLEPYHTETLEYHFYFPAAGKYSHFPVHVAQQEKLIASVPPFTFPVVAEATNIDKEAWDYLSQHGGSAQVLAYLDKQNVHRLDLELIAWRMKDAKFFAQVIAKLTERHAYHDTLWSYALLHDVPAAVREFLQHSDLVFDCGGRLQSTLLTIDPIERREYQHLEYKPLVNARAHALGQRRQIVNDAFHEQYHYYLEDLCFASKLGAEDLLAVTYYLLLQDRVEEALATFARVKRADTEMTLQYDYLAAYLDFFSADHQQARAIALKYVNHPVDRWRKTFAAIIAQLDEAEGKDVKTVDREQQTQQQTELAATEPNFDFVVEAKQIKIDYQNLTAARISFYLMDVELLFSRNPFVGQYQSEFSAIRPHSTLDLKLAAEKKSHTVDLPAALQGKNVVIEVAAAGQTKTVPHFSHALAVQVVENYGQIRVTQSTSDKPVPKAYVKVYARLPDGSVKFYKDGYTDIRGRFDYASISGQDLLTATKFSLLILSDELGAVVKEATPPKQ